MSALASVPPHAVAETLAANAVTGDSASSLSPKRLTVESTVQVMIMLAIGAQTGHVPVDAVSAPTDVMTEPRPDHGTQPEAADTPADDPAASVAAAEQPAMAVSDQNAADSSETASTVSV